MNAGPRGDRLDQEPRRRIAGAVRQARRWYWNCALIALNALMIFVALNVIVAAFRSVRDVAHQGFVLSNRQMAPLIWKYGMDRLVQAYPGWRRDELIELLEENRVLLEYEPFTQTRPSTARGKYINVSSAGFRRGTDDWPWPPDPAAANILIFGGSTAFGTGVPDGRTIPSVIQEYFGQDRCRPPVRVYNLGRPTYFSSQERILFEELMSAGVRARIVVFIDGLNEFVFDEPALTTELRRIVMLATERTIVSLPGRIYFALKDLPAVSVIEEAQNRATAKREAQEESGFDAAAHVRRAIERWSGNRRIIQELAGAHDMKVMFVWQPVPTYGYDIQYHLFSQGGLATRVRSAEGGYRLMSELWPSLGGDFVWLGDMQAGRRENLYVDFVHYSEAFSRDIAKRIYCEIRRSRALPCGGGAEESCDAG